MSGWPPLSDATPVDLEIETPVTHRWLDVGEVTLHVALAGPEDGRPLILLHGFPEAWFGWRHQIDALATAGFRVAMPDQRGYNLSGKPPKVSDYALPKLAQDVAGIARALGWKRYGVVGHDWGAAVVWQLMDAPPTGLVAACAINVPHLRVMRRFLLTSRQIIRSLYILFFQLPWIPEWALGRNASETLVQKLLTSSIPGTFSDAELADYRRAWGREGALRSGLAWYRAAFRRPKVPPKGQRITVPMLILWGEQDQFLGKEMVAPSADCVEDVEVIRFPDATHWVAHEAPEAVNAALVKFFGARLTG